MANDMCLGEIIDNAVRAACNEQYNTAARKATLVPDEYERMEFLRDPVEAYNNCVQQLGSGVYGTARLTASGFVVKQFEMKDAYGMWLSFCMMAYHRGTGNAQLPKVFAMSIPEREDVCSYGFALIERLHRDRKEKPLRDSAYQDREQATHAFRDGLASILNQVNDGNAIGGLTKSPLERLWAEFLLLAKQRRMIVGSDTHMGNLLFRNYGEENEVSVLTDPAVLSDGSFRQASKFMYDMLTMVSAYRPGLWSEMRSRTIIETTVQ